MKLTRIKNCSIASVYMKYFFMFTEIKEDTAKLTKGLPIKKTFAKSGRVKRAAKFTIFRRRGSTRLKEI